MIVFDGQRKPVQIGDAVGHGGEATVYHIASQPGRLAKIYEPAPRPNYADKLAWMVNHPPENPTSSLNHASLAWPDGLLFDAKRSLTGYLMPQIRHAVPLLEVFNPRRRAEVLPEFDRRYLLRSARNLAAALSALHRSGYVAGDINESNILVTPTALVTLIDTDSFQVREESGGRQVVHPCPVGKPEYTPPELQGQALSQVIRLPDHDAFGLAVLIFQLLMEGSHPFRAQWLAAGDPPPLEVRIANGAYPYIESPAYPVRPPKNALGVNTLHPWLAELFRRCFVDGHLDPRWRPGPDLWVRALTEAEQSMVRCSEGHYYSSQLDGCPYCAIQPRRTPTGRQVPRSRTAWPAASPTKPNATPTGAAGPVPYRRMPRAARRTPNATVRMTGGQGNPTTPSAFPAFGAAPAAAPAAASAGGNPAAAVPASGSGSVTGGAQNVFRSATSFSGILSSLLGGPGQPSLFTGPGSAAFYRGSGVTIPGAASFGGVLRSRPIIPPGAIRNWARQRAYKSLIIGGGQGALAGALPGAVVGLANWASGDLLSWSLLMAIGGAGAGLLRGWLPGHKLASVIDRYVGWKLFWEGIGLVGGLVAGGLVGMLFVWAVFPVILGLVLGAQVGLFAGRKIFQVGSHVGWERIWGVFSALGFGALGFGLAKLIGLGGVSAFGANLADGLLPFAANGSFMWAVIWMLAGATGGALAGGLAGILADVIGRFTGLVD